jgi:undecaprenyl-diphosphatase
VVQGVLEWLPVSSSGQGMVFLTRFLDFDVVSAFRLMFVLHFGTMLAAVVKYRNEFRGLVYDAVSMKNTPLLRFMVVSTFFSFASGGLLYLVLLDSLEAVGSEFVMVLVGLFLVATGFVLFLTRKSYGSSGVGDLSFKDTAAVGLVQGFSVIPGLSRSGVTVASLLLSDVRQDEALRLSFLMSVPVVFGATVVELFQGVSGMTPASVLIGVVSAFTVGYLTMSALVSVSRRLRFDVFCVLYGLLGVLWVLVPLM